jgi:hypothetical protein
VAGAAEVVGAAHACGQAGTVIMTITVRVTGTCRDTRRGTVVITVTGTCSETVTGTWRLV